MQSDLKVALSAPSAPSLPSFAHSSQPYALSDPPSLPSFANSSQPYDALSEPPAKQQLAAFGHLSDGRPPLPSSAGQKGLPFTGLPTGPKFALSGANRDRNAIV